MPLTLHQPKPMIGIVDKPMVHYVIDEIVSAGIKHIIIVHGPGQKEFREYADYLQNDPGWKKLNVKFDFTVQKNPYGNGDAVFAAKKFLRKEPFLVAFSDDLLADEFPPMRSLVSLFTAIKEPILALEPVEKKLLSKYGVVKAKKSKIAPDLYEISDIVEKPKIKEAPSNLTIIGRYVLNAKVLQFIENLYPYKGKEIGIADALKNYAQAGNKLFGWRFRGNRFDGGSKIGILKAQAYFGFHHQELGPEFKEFLKKRL